MLAELTRPSVAAIPNLANVGNVRVRNEFVTEPLNQLIAYGKEPHGKYWFVDAKDIALDFTDISFATNDIGAIFTLKSIGAFTPLSTASFAKGRKPFPEASLGGTSCRHSSYPYNFYNEGIAEFDITYVESWLWDGTVDSHVDSLSNSTETQAVLDRMRAELQLWLAASVDDLAMLLNLSPTTIVNITKPGRSVRAKTVRKMSVVHSLLKELQRVIGTRAALAWAQSTGRRLLADGDIYEFEQFVSTHIFPSMERKPTSPASFGNDEADLIVKDLAPAGKASRF